MSDYMLDDNPAPIKVDIEKELAEIERWAEKGVIKRHYGPGPHPGTGTEQSVHGGGESGGKAARDPADILTDPAVKVAERGANTVVEWNGHQLEIWSQFQDRQAEIIDTMDNVYRKALKREPELTEMMQELEYLSEGELHGIEYRVKTPASIVTKIQRKMMETGRDAEGAATLITDLNRYTLVFDRENFVDDVIGVQHALSGRGWRQYDDKWKNYFAEGDDYDGYNTVMIHDESNTVFELQYHTRETVERKQESWKIYQEHRTLPPNAPEAPRLFKQMMKIWRGYPKPEGWDRLPGSVMGQ